MALPWLIGIAAAAVVAAVATSDDSSSSSSYDDDKERLERERRREEAENKRRIEEAREAARKAEAEEKARKLQLFMEKKRGFSQSELTKLCKNLGVKNNSSVINNVGTIVVDSEYGTEHLLNLATNNLLEITLEKVAKRLERETKQKMPKNQEITSILKELQEL